MIPKTPRWTNLNVCIFTLGLAILLLIPGDSSGQEPNCNQFTTVGSPVQLTFNSADDVEPSWSPDGTMIAFTRNRQEIYIIDLATGTEASVTSNGNSNWHPDWSPDGQLISYTGGPNSDQIWVSAPDGSGETAITTSGPHRHPDWSPDGSEFAYTAIIGVEGPVRRINSDGSGTPSTVVSSGWYADWSPDGSRIAFARYYGGGQIYLVDHDGGNLKNISTSSNYHAYPAWSPNGSTIACSITKSGNSEIYIIDTLGNELLQVTNWLSSSEGYPTWSPSGDAIAFHSNRSGNGDIWKVGIECDGGGQPGDGANILVYVTWDASCSYPCCCYPMSFFDEGLSQVLGSDGHTVTLTDRVSTPTITPALLANYDQLWFLSTAETHNVVLATAEINAVLDFRNQGGGLFIAADHASHYTWTANQIASPLGVQFYGSVDHASEFTCLSPTFDSHPIFTGVSELGLGRNEGDIAMTSPADVVATFNGHNVVAVLDDGAGRCVFDGSFVRTFDSQIILCDNATYFRNIANWLQEGGGQGGPALHALGLFSGLANRLYDGGLQSHYESENRKHLVYFEISKIVGGALYVDLDDYYGVTPEGRNDLITVWLDVGIGFGLPAAIGIVDVPMLEFEHDRKRRWDFSGPSASLGPIGINFLRTTPDGFDPTGTDWFEDAELSGTIVNLSYNALRFEVTREFLDATVDNAFQVATGAGIITNLGERSSNMLDLFVQFDGIKPRFVASLPWRRFTKLDSGEHDIDDGVLNYVRGGMDQDEDGVPDNIYPIGPAFLGIPLMGASLEVEFQNTGNVVNSFFVRVEGENDGWRVGAFDNPNTTGIPPRWDAKFDVSDVAPSGPGDQAVQTEWAVYCSRDAVEEATFTFELHIDDLLTNPLVDEVTVTFFKNVEDQPLVVAAMCPVDILVTDQTGAYIGKNDGNLVGAVYTEIWDLNNDGTLDDIVTLREHQTRSFVVEVFPEDDALPTDSFSLTVQYLDQLYDIASNVMVAAIADGGYRFSSLDTGSIHGTVSASSNGLLGIPVDLYDSDGHASTVTNETGFYEFAALYNGAYSVSISTPLGYQTDEEIKEIEVKGLPHEVNFELTQLEVPLVQRGRGYWMHQVNALLSGNGNTHETYDDMCGYMELIRTHFNEHGYNQINVFEVALTDDCDQRMEALRATISPKPKASMNEKARAHLTALLLNMVSGKIAQWTFVSEDSASLSQAITWCNILITDDDLDNDEMAKDIAGLINDGQTVPAGWIDLLTPDISYKHADNILPEAYMLHQNYPNPFNPKTEIRFDLPKSGDVTINVYNTLGQKITTLVNGDLPAGVHTVEFDGTDFASGVYFYRLEAGEFTQTKKMVLMK